MTEHSITGSWSMFSPLKSICHQYAAMFASIIDIYFKLPFKYTTSSFLWSRIYWSKAQNVKTYGHTNSNFTVDVLLFPLRCYVWCVWSRFPRRWRTLCIRSLVQVKNWAAWWCSQPAFSSSCRPSACRCSASWRSWTVSPRSPGWGTSHTHPVTRRAISILSLRTINVVYLPKLLWVLS